MIDTDVERGPFWPVQDRIPLVESDGKFDFKIILPVTSSEYWQMFDPEVLARLYALLDLSPPAPRKPKPDSEFVLQVKEKLGIPVDAE